MKKIILIILSMTICFTMYAEKTKLDVSIYGYVKMDAVYETGNSSHGNFIIWAADPGENKGLFHLTGNETRFGFKIKGVNIGNFKVTANIEVDFYGGGGSPETQAHNYLRHAYIKISDGSFSVFAGQTADIISPYVASTLNYTVLWGQGNIGNRRPQLSFMKTFKSEKSTISLQGGFFRDVTPDYDGDGVADGTASGMPSVQGRLGGKFLLGNSSLSLGLSGHYGKSSGITKYVSQSINFDFLFAINKTFTLVAEYFTGKNLGAYLGGILQNVNNGVEIESKGYFVNLITKLSKKASLSVGYGLDDPDDNQLSVGMRSKNSAIFGNYTLKLSSNFTTGLEICFGKTEYTGLDSQSTTRFQNSWIFSF